ncbi:hypothetical protein DSCW_20180 [Desulfosarcina widdelii]|uniref:Uncharacterized protein n=1 Tax=Desulfosarcina widdelii TaxID=947919 RepID=A0A5K7Z4R8_9BACT|nr:hypothetical protein DSCW_20180 [Desulfosarcina widdelii]
MSSYRYKGYIIPGLDRSDLGWTGMVKGWEPTAQEGQVRPVVCYCNVIRFKLQIAWLFIAVMQVFAFLRYDLSIN